MDDFREAYHWLSHNTASDARVMSWWDYGYQIAGMANRTTMVDNNTWNNSHIALVSLFISLQCKSYADLIQRTNRISDPNKIVSRLYVCTKKEQIEKNSCYFFN